MANFFEEQDELNLDINITGDEEAQRKLEEFVAQSRAAAAQLNKVIDTTGDFTKKTVKNFLPVQKKIQQLTTQFIALGKVNFGDKFKDSQQFIQQNVLKLTQYLARVQEIEAILAKGISGPGSVKLRNQLKKEFNEIVREINQGGREILKAKQLALLASLDPQPTKQRKISKEYLDRRIERLQTKALTVESQLGTLGGLDKRSYMFTNIANDANVAKRPVEDLYRRLAELQRLIQSTDSTDYSQLEEYRKEAQQLTGELREVRRQYIALKSAANKVSYSPINAGLNKPNAPVFIGPNGLPLGASPNRLGRFANYNPFGGGGAGRPGGPGGFGGGGGGAGRGALGYASQLSGVLGLGSFGSGLGPIAAIGGSVLALERFAHYSKIAIDRAVEATRANRLLASSATEAGLGYAELSKKNAEFADKIGLSTVAAARTTAKITQLATRTQRPENVSKLQTAFADLGAARGLDSTELETIIQQIITGQDEGYKKLLLPNPSQLYADYAKKNKRSTASLSSVERSQIFEEAATRKAAIFVGAAEARMQSLDGRVNKLNASFENLANNLSLRFANSYEVTQTIDLLTKTFKSLNVEIDDLVTKTERGISIEVDIKDKADPGFLINQLNTIRRGANVFSAFAYGLVDPRNLGLSAGTGIDKFIADQRDAAIRGVGDSSPEAQRVYRENQLYQTIHAERRVRFFNAQTARDRRLEIAREQAEEDRSRRISEREKYYQDQFKKRRRTPEDIQSVLSEIGRDSGSLAKTLGDVELRKIEDDIQKYITNLDPQEYINKVGERERLIEAKRLELTEIANIKLEVENKPLLDEEAKEKLTSQGLEDLSRVVEQIHRRALDNPKLKVSELFAKLGQVKGDTRLFPEIREALSVDIEKRLDDIAKKAQALKLEFQELLINNAATETGNSFVNILGKIDVAFDNTFEKMKFLGVEFAKFAADSAKKAAEYELTVETYRAQDRALQYRQEARRLGQIQEIDTSNFQQRLEAAVRNVEFLKADQLLSKAAEVEDFYANIYSAYNPDRSFLVNKYGFNQVDRFTQDFNPGGRQGNEDPLEYQKRVNEEREKYLQTSIKINDYIQDQSKYKSIDIEGLGLYGQEAVAQALLERLPSIEELLPRLDAFGQTKFDAESILQDRAKYSQILVEANRQKFDDFVIKQQFLDVNRKDAEERLALLEQQSGLNDKDRLDQFLQITSEIGAGNLTPQLRQARIRALNDRADLEERQRKLAEETLSEIKSTTDKLGKLITDSGLKVDTGENPVLDININNNTGYNATGIRRANNQDVTNANQ